MKVLDQEVDTRSAEYLDNYEQMIKQNEELDRITKMTMNID